MVDARRTVWILGAGFSRSLGGPLLPDLLSPATTNFVGGVYRTNPFIGDGNRQSGERAADCEAASIVRLMYEEFGGETAPPGRRFWSDAEAFLDQLDAAHHGGPESPAAMRIQNAWTLARFRNGPLPDCSTLREAARRLVAAACCSFLRDADTNEERWQPYLSWAQDTGASDTILTFNYDRVLEHLGDHFMVVEPSKQLHPSSTQAQVFKLHGSVDWSRLEGPKTTGTRFVVTQEPEHALTCPGYQLGIATPGPTKKIAANELAVLWAEAVARIKAAEVIVLVGYRFPPGDAEAREKLLGAITANLSPHVELHVVLGPDRAHKDVVRLEQLLRYAMTKRGRDERARSEIKESREGLELVGQIGPKQSFALTTHALFAEDFFTVWERHLLWPGIRVLGHGGLGAAR
jgi:hypothetical protein